MSTCQIATVGRNPEWIQLGLFRYPTKLLVLITTENYLDKAGEIRELVKGIEVRIEIIKKPRDSNYIVEFLKNLINSLYEEKYDVLMNVTSGLASWQLLCYSTATILQDKVKKFFIIDKEQNEPLELVLYSPLTPTERKVLQIIPEEGASLRTLTDHYHKQFNEGTAGLLSRYLKRLMEESLIKTHGSSKSKTFHLTEKGKLIQNVLS
ncbi:hypothetical protein [Candidatus Hodarchaeum mangrovi]